jgi:hypothetical protein
VLYPKAVRFKTEFASGDLDVYEGSVRILVSFPANGLVNMGALRGVLTAQACDAKICLPPSKIRFSVESRVP